jgi:hypothetical protein
MQRNIMMYSCPKFEACNAPICPMDPNWRKGAHLSGERVCLWLRELQKCGGEARVQARLRGDQFQTVLVASNEIGSGCAYPAGASQIRHVLREAAKGGSKLDAGSRLKEQHG